MNATKQTTTSIGNVNEAALNSAKTNFFQTDTEMTTTAVTSLRNEVEDRMSSASDINVIETILSSNDDIESYSFSSNNDVTELATNSTPFNNEDHYFVSLSSLIPTTKMPLTTNEIIRITSSTIRKINAKTFLSTNNTITAMSSTKNFSENGVKDKISSTNTNIDLKTSFSTDGLTTTSSTAATFSKDAVVDAIFSAIRSIDVDTFLLTDNMTTILTPAATTSKNSVSNEDLLPIEKTEEETILPTNDKTTILSPVTTLSEKEFTEKTFSTILNKNVQTFSLTNDMTTILTPVATTSENGAIDENLLFIEKLDEKTISSTDDKTTILSPAATSSEKEFIKETSLTIPHTNMETVLSAGDTTVILPNFATFTAATASKISSSNNNVPNTKTLTTSKNHHSTKTTLLTNLRTTETLFSTTAPILKPKSHDSSAAITTTIKDALILAQSFTNVSAKKYSHQTASSHVDFTKPKLTGSEKMLSNFFKPFSKSASSPAHDAATRSIASQSKTNDVTTRSIASQNDFNASEKISSSDSSESNRILIEETSTVQNFGRLLNGITLKLQTESAHSLTRGPTALYVAPTFTQNGKLFSLHELLLFVFIL